MKTYLVHGFHQQNHARFVWMLVDVDERDRLSAAAIAELIAPEFCFPTFGSVDVAVPDDCKARLFTEAELCDAVPALRSWFPRQRKRRSRR